MQHLISGIPEPFKTSVLPAEVQPLEAAPIPYWGFTRNGIILDSRKGKLGNEALVDAFLLPEHASDLTRTKGPIALRPSTDILVMKTLYNLDWDGRRLMCTISPYTASGEGPDEPKAPWCGWNAKLQATPILDQRIVTLLGKVKYVRTGVPFVSLITQAAPEQAVLSMVDWVWNYQEFDSLKTWDIRNKDYTPLFMNLSRSQRETLLSLAPEWVGDAESLAKAARKI